MWQYLGLKGDWAKVMDERRSISSYCWWHLYGTFNWRGNVPLNTSCWRTITCRNKERPVTSHRWQWMQKSDQVYECFWGFSLKCHALVNNKVRISRFWIFSVSWLLLTLQYRWGSKLQAVIQHPMVCCRNLHHKGGANDGSECSFAPRDIHGRFSTSYFCCKMGSGPTKPILPKGNI